MLADTFLEAAVDAAKQTGAALRAGDCRKAYVRLLNAQGAIHSAATEVANLPEADNRKWIDDNMDTIDKFAKLTQVFQDRCVR